MTSHSKTSMTSAKLVNSEVENSYSYLIELFSHIWFIITYSSIELLGILKNKQFSDTLLSEYATRLSNLTQGQTAFDQTTFDLIPAHDGHPKRAKLCARRHDLDRIRVHAGVRGFESHLRHPGHLQGHELRSGNFCVFVSFICKPDYIVPALYVSYPHDFPSYTFRKSNSVLCHTAVP